VKQVWRQTLWTDIRTDVMEEGTKAFVKEVKALPKAVRDEDCFKVPLQPAHLLFPCLVHPSVRNKLWHCCLGQNFLLQY